MKGVFGVQMPGPVKFAQQPKAAAPPALPQWQQAAGDLIADLLNIGRKTDYTPGPVAPATGHRADQSLPGVPADTSAGNGGWYKGLFDPQGHFTAVYNRPPIPLDASPAVQAVSKAFKSAGAAVGSYADRLRADYIPMSWRKAWRQYSADLSPSLDSLDWSDLRTSAAQAALYGVGTYYGVPPWLLASIRIGGRKNHKEQYKRWRKYGSRAKGLYRRGKNRFNRLKKFLRGSRMVKPARSSQFYNTSPMRSYAGRWHDTKVNKLKKSGFRFMKSLRDPLQVQKRKEADWRLRNLYGLYDNK